MKFKFNTQTKTVNLEEAITIEQLERLARIFNLNNDWIVIGEVSDSINRKPSVTETATGIKTPEKDDLLTQIIKAEQKAREDREKRDKDIKGWINENPNKYKQSYLNNPQIEELRKIFEDDLRPYLTFNGNKFETPLTEM